MYVDVLNTHDGAPSKAVVYAHCGAFSPLLATFVSHCDKVPSCRSAFFSAAICGQRKVAAGEEIDGVGMVMDTGSLAQLTAPHPPGISYHCLAPRFPGKAFD